MANKYLNDTGLVYLISKIKTALSNKVDAVSGKGLSTNDYTTTEKNKLAGIAEGANKTVVDSAMSSNSVNPVQNKVINSALGAKAPLASPAFTGTPTAPTAKAGTSNTQIATTAFVASTVAAALSEITDFKFSIVTSLPTTGANGTIYLISNNGSETNNSYDEYIWVNDKFEKIGTTSVDLSGYMRNTDMVAIATAEIDSAFV